METITNENMSNLTDLTPTAMENLYPALTECFAIILCGYMAGRMNLISETEAKGMNTFVGTFSLPSLIFMSLAQLDLSSVNWLFLASILIAKAIVFFSVIIITILVGRPVNLGRAGIFAIFCTQSNDFAIGYPIVVALYKKTHPDYPSYLYLMAPISLAILNPIAFILMEIGKRRNSLQENPMQIDFIANNQNNLNKEKCKVVLSVIKGIITNPIIFMTILGILGNLIFSHKVPTYFGGILEVLGSAFSASALFLLGLRMVGKIHTLKGATLIVPGIIIAVKLLALPLVTREVVSVLHVGNSVNDTLDLSTYGFLYGTFPSAPTVFVFSTQYNIDIDLIASAMVACTFLSAPLMFISAKMITLTKIAPSHYVNELDNFAFDISVASIIACVWLLLTFIITKKIRNIPHRVTICLVISQLLSCIGVIMWSTGQEKQDWTGFLQFMIFTIGVYSSRIWTAFLAVSLTFMQCRSLCFIIKLQPYFIVAGWGIPVFIAMFLMIFDKENVIPIEKRNPNFQYGLAQALIAVCLLILCFIVTVGCLILHQRYKKRYTQYMNMANEVAANIQNDTTDNESSEESVLNGVPSPSKPVIMCGNLPTISEGCCSETQNQLVDIEDLLSPSSPIASCLTTPVCQGPARKQCSGLRQQYEDQINTEIDVEEEPVNYDPQILRHIILLILLLCSMFVGLAISIWTLVMEEMTGIYIELAFLDATLNFGQSLIVFAIFGMDTKELLIPLLKVWRKIWYGADTLKLPSVDDLSFETKHVCDQFITHHLENCMKTIAKDTRWRLKIYRKAFTGTKMVDWLIEIGLAHDRVEAVHYARHLLEGRVIRHINDVHYFYDRNFLYNFV